MGALGPVGLTLRILRDPAPRTVVGHAAVMAAVRTGAGGPRRTGVRQGRRLVGMESATALLTVDEAARRLGIEPRRIKQLVRDHQLFLVPAPDGSAAVPEEIITRVEGGWEPLWNLPGTLTLLADGGFSPSEAVNWLYTEREELGSTPMAALLAGRHHLVNTIAGTLAF